MIAKVFLFILISVLISGFACATEKQFSYNGQVSRIVKALDPSGQFTMVFSGSDPNTLQNLMSGSIPTSFGSFPGKSLSINPSGFTRETTYVNGKKVLDTTRPLTKMTNSFSKDILGFKSDTLASDLNQNFEQSFQKISQSNYNLGQGLYPNFQKFQPYGFLQTQNNPHYASPVRGNPKASVERDSSKTFSSINSQSDLGTQEVSEENWEEMILKQHNEYRAKHGVGPLKLNKKISSHAQEWADRLARENSIYHRDPNKYGENIFQGEPLSLGPKLWYNEIKNYDFNSRRLQSGTGHFTAMVWKDTKEIGCGKRHNGMTLFLVCNYDPPGNISVEELVAQNVLPPK